MAKPYREGKGWAVRVRIRGQSVYLSGLPTEAAAKKAAAEQTLAIQNLGKPARQGPERTCVAQAMQDYAQEKLPFLKGARQDANRMNNYLRAAGQDTVQVTPIPAKAKRESGNRTVHCSITLQPHCAERTIVNSLKAHRASQAGKTTRTDRVRQRLACTRVSDVTPYHVQELVNAMQTDGYEPASVHLEVAQIKRLFFYAAEKWLWTTPARNPATGLDLPKVDNARERVLNREEWKALCAALDAYPNPYVAPAIGFLLETATRVSEPLVHAQWADVDWERAVLTLFDGKAGGREVPLTPGALRLLTALHAKREGDGDAIFPLSYEALKKGFSVACAAAGIENLHVHDLRHTAATGYTLSQVKLVFRMAKQSHRKGHNVAVQITSPNGLNDKSKTDDDGKRVIEQLTRLGVLCEF